VAISGLWEFLFGKKWRCLPWGGQLGQGAWAAMAREIAGWFGKVDIL